MNEETQLSTKLKEVLENNKIIMHAVTGEEPQREINISFVRKKLNIKIGQFKI